MRNTLIDAGPIIALFDRDDKNHEAVESFLSKFKGHLITTWPVITETSHMLSFNTNVQINFLTWIKRKAVTIFPLTGDHIERLIELVKKYADLPMDLADGSLIVVSEILNTTNILTIDADYYIYRTKDRKSFKNLLEKHLYIDRKANCNMARNFA
ncbi:hypothetical protein ES703_13638 [subsurface metagenome]